MERSVQHPAAPVVALIGAGRMGLGLLKSLRRARFEVHAWDRDVEALRAAAALGAVAAPTAPAALEWADVVVVSLPATVVERALCDDGGVADAAAPGTVIVDTSTLAPEVASRVSDRVVARGARYLASPVSGGPTRAESGGLVALVGGDGAAFERARPVIESIADAVFHLGPVAAAGTVKLAHQAMFYGSLAVFAEVARVLDGVADPSQACAALEQCVARNNAVAWYGRNMIEGVHDTGQFPVSAASAELWELLDAVAARDLDAPVVEAIAATFERAVREGHGQRDLSSIAEPLRAPRSDSANAQ